ncbi:hypothetical protein Tco_0702300 [Tanacetum coccineum]|uniref:Uncharacterized protein n=1 Tax=Tanacetum coccineum TaxID=301880 RepID=A0ABQ4XVL1_9ASTR
MDKKINTWALTSERDQQKKSDRHARTTKSTTKHETKHWKELCRREMDTGEHTESLNPVSKALKNELRKLKGNSVDTKFAKPSILGKPVLQPPRNQSVVRQPNAFKSERPNFSKPRFASQVDVNNVLSKPVTQHYLPKGRESAFAKPNHMIASSSSRNSSKNMPRFSSNDMVHNYYLEEAKKKTQERDRKSTTSVMPSAKSQNTTKSCKSKPRSNNQTSRVLPTSKSSCPTTTVMPKADHSRNSSPFSDFKHFVCSTCQKCVFNANHDACITKFLKEVNSRAKIQPNKTRNSNKPVDPTSHTQKPGRKIVTGHSFSPNKSSVVHEKTNTPRSYLRWMPKGRIFNTASLKWVPTGKTFTSSTTKVDCELPNGSNDYITNPYKCDQTLNVSAGTLNLSAGTFCNPEKERLGVCLLKKVIYQKPRVPGIYTTLQAPLLKEKKSVRFSELYLQKKRNLLMNYSMELLYDVSKSSTVHVADNPIKRQQQKHNSTAYNQPMLQIHLPLEHVISHTQTPTQYQLNRFEDSLHQLLRGLEACTIEFIAYAAHKSIYSVPNGLKTAFLLRPPEEEVYVNQQMDLLTHINLNKVYRHKKAYMVLKQAPRRGMRTLQLPVPTDFSKNPKLSKQFGKLMHSKFDMSMMGELKFFLGIQIHQSPRAIANLVQSSQHSRTKHIDVRYHFIKEQVEKGIVELFFVGTEYQLADLFTKALSEDRFKYLVRQLGMRCLTPDELEVLAIESA